MKNDRKDGSIIDMLMRLGHTLPIPNLDVERIISHHRRNIEALEQSAKVGTQGASEMLARQNEMLQQVLEQATNNARAIKLPSSPRELLSTQIDFARHVFEIAVENTGELGAMMQKSGSDSVDILRRRITEAMDELQKGFDKKSP